MQITKISSPADAGKVPTVRYTEENLISDLNYYRAEKLTKKLLDKGLITEEQSVLIMAENRRTFQPFLSEIL